MLIGKRAASWALHIQGALAKIDHAHQFHDVTDSKCIRDQFSYAPRGGIADSAYLSPIDFVLVFVSAIFLKIGAILEAAIIAMGEF